RILCRPRPEGLVTRDDFDFDETEMPEPGDDEFVMKVEYLGMDATVRTWLSQSEGYLPPVEIGEVVRGSGVGRVIASRTPNVPEGALVASLPGWQEYAV